jgi:Putative protein-S-isoprenylcysteine methyltransferase
VFLIFVENDINFYALSVIAVGILIRFWAAGYIHKDKEVTIAGPYKLLRHPLYLGNFIEGLGFALFVNSWQLVVLYIPIFWGIYYKKMHLEEQYLRNEFGTQYNDYQETTPRFIPKLRNLSAKDNVQFSWQNVIRNREHLNFLGIVIITAVFITYQSNLGLFRNTLSLLRQAF